MPEAQESFTFTVGKLDAGMAILIGERAHLIEFPSLLLPAGVSSGSIVNIAVHRNRPEEKRQKDDFWKLQDDIYKTFGVHRPEFPQLELRHVTQTAVALEWPAIELATAKLRSLDIYRDGQRLAAIPSPMQNTSTKLSGLQMDKDYTFQLILRTTAGLFPSNVARVRTHTINDTSGISVCFGTVQDSVLLEECKNALREMKGKWSSKIQIDTTHFVCTSASATPAGAQAVGSLSEQPGVEYQRALQLSLPILHPNWVLACYSEKKMVPIAPYNLGASSSPPPGSTTVFARPASLASISQTNLTQEAKPKAASAAGSQSASGPAPEPLPPHPESPTSPDQPAEETQASPPPSNNDEQARTAVQTHKRVGTMSKDFKFPPAANNESQPAEDTESRPSVPGIVVHSPQPSVTVGSIAEVVKASATTDQPPKTSDGTEEEVGEIVEVDLN